MRFPAWLISSVLLWSSIAGAQAPRVAVLVAGDPTDAAVTAATNLGLGLVESAAVTLPSDQATVSALTGGPGSTEDGLDELRGLRRRLGITTDGDREVLDTIGARLEVVVIVVVKGATSPTARVYDVNEHRFFTGEAALDVASAEATRDFVVARAEAAARRRNAPPPDATAAAATTVATPATPAATGEAPPRRSFMRRNWPFFVAAALLVGATTYFVVERRNDDTSPPVIHIRPGGN